MSSLESKNEKLRGAAQDGDIAQMRSALDAGAQIDSIGSGFFGGISSLMGTAIKDHDKALQFLIERGANINLQGDEGHSALMCAAMIGNLKSGRALLDAGADRSLKNKEGETALQIAENNGFNEFAEMMRTYKRTLPKKPDFQAVKQPLMAEVNMSDQLASTRDTLTRQITDFERRATNAIQSAFGASDSIQASASSIFNKLLTQSSKTVSFIQSDVAAMNRQFVQFSNAESRAQKQEKVTETISNCLVNLEHEIHELAERFTKEIVERIESLGKRTENQRKQQEQSKTDEEELRNWFIKLLQQLEEKLDALQWSTQQDIAQLKMETNIRIESLEQKVSRLESLLKKLAKLERSHDISKSSSSDLETLREEIAEELAKID